ncbi:MAG: ComEC/Rec2 family competence protein [Nanoarchaeota archaeon]|nr:ComEC/Rec2 family competence protein [Nanoarchaeota archaeon]
MNKKILIFWSIFIAAAFFRVWQSFDIKPPNIGSCIKQIVSGVGVVTEEPERKETGQILIVSTESLAIASTSKSCGVDVFIKMKTKLYPRFIFGDRITFNGKLLQPANFDSGAGRTFDYKGYLAKNDIYHEMKSAVVGKETGVEVESVVKETDSTSSENWTTIILEAVNSKLYSVKRKFVNNLEKTLGEPHATLAAGLVVGEKATLGKDLLNDFRIVGLIHIVVLSGYNITIVGDAMRRLLSFLPRVWGITVGGIGIAMFGIMVGGGATVVRSCFMAGVALSADLIRRDYDVIRALFFAGLIMLIQNPMILLHDPSFQLSFLATLGLILLASPIEKHLTFITERFGMRGIVASTIATQIFVSPYILYMMGQLSIIGMIVNILVLPLIPITMLFVFLTGTVGMIYLSFAQFFGWIAHFLLSYELFMVQNFARLPFAAVQMPTFSGWWVVGFYMIFAVIFFLKNGKLARM